MTIQCKAFRHSRAGLAAFVLTTLLSTAAWPADSYVYTDPATGGFWNGTHLGFILDVPNWHDVNNNTDANFPPAGNFADLGGAKSVSNVTVNLNYSYQPGQPLQTLFIFSNNTLSQASDSTMDANFEVVGFESSSGSYVQSAGANFTNALAVGRGFGNEGTYTLSGGTLSVVALLDGSGGLEEVGNTGNATFNQSGGTHMAVNLSVGAFRANGTFNLSGGTLAISGDESVGDRGVGAFTQSGDSTHTVGGTLYLATKNPGRKALSTFRAAH